MDIYKELSKERKALQAEGALPEWVTTLSYQMIKDKVLTEDYPTFHDVVSRISKAAGRHTDSELDWSTKFYNLIWRGWLACSTPVIANMGADKGCPVSCSGNFVSDNVHSFYESMTENAVLSQNGFGTSSCLDAIRARGTKISKGGTASGVLPVLKANIQLSRDISQGCYDEDTEILTSTGWVYFRDMKLDTRVAQVLDDHSVEFLIPLKYFAYEVDEELVHFKDSRNIDLLVTKNHNMVTRPRKRLSNARDVNGKFKSHKKMVSTQFQLTKADELNVHRDTVFDFAGVANGLGEFTPYHMFLVALQADGSRTKYSKTAFTFRFTKKRKIGRLKTILKALPEFVYTVNSNNKEGVTSFYVQTKKNLSKDLSWVVLEGISQAFADGFLREIMLWDGNQKSSYSSIVKLNADIIQAVASISGYRCSVTKDMREKDKNKQPIYKVHVSDTKTFGGSAITKKLKHYKGKVYCVEVPSNKLIVRRGGRTLICGNSTRRGAWAGYISIEHGDFYEICEFIISNPDDCNIGWNIHDSFINKLMKEDKEALSRYQRALKVKMVTGKGYFFFIDKVNRQSPQCYKDRGLTVKASNLCSEITLHSDEEHSFSCVLSSLNLAKYNEWKDTSAVSDSIMFLDCVAQEMIEIGKNVPGMDKVVAFTEKSRALGLGTLGFHTYLQQEGIPFESLQAQYKNIEIYSYIDDEAVEMSRRMGLKYGIPEWCDGSRHTHLTAVAPNMSSAIICGSVSQGVEPIYKNAYLQAGASGEMQRINPVLVSIMRKLKVFNPENIQDIINNGGSVQHVDWLDEMQKKVFKTAFEINQHVIIRLASQRQQYICQGQSINLFFSADESEEYISAVHKDAFLDPNLKALYYIRSEANVTGSTGECSSCEG